MEALDLSVLYEQDETAWLEAMSTRFKDFTCMQNEGDVGDTDRQVWEKEFAAAARRPLALRLRYAFLHTYKPILDDVSFRSFERMADYRQWCETQLPSWLGYGRV